MLSEGAVQRVVKGTGSSREDKWEKEGSSRKDECEKEKEREVVRKRLDPRDRRKDARRMIE